MHPIRTILHPTDFSKHSDYALRVASTIARDAGARLIVLHAFHAAEPPVWIYDQMAGTFPWTTDPSRALELRLQALRESNPGLQAETRLSKGAAAEEILRSAEAERCDLIVMGTEGRMGLDRLLVGSVAAAVMRKSHCPVVTVKDPTPIYELREDEDELVPAAEFSRGALAPMT